MSLSIGIVGLPNSGKSTLFNALLGRQVAKAESYPFCTIEPNTGVVEVPDERLDKIAEIIQPKKKVPAAIKFVDIAGLVEGAHKGAGLGNQFLSHIREVDAILYLLRDFDASVAKAGSINPPVDYEVLQTELVLKDLETLEKIVKKKPADEEEKKRKKLAEKLIPGLEKGASAIDIQLTDEEEKIMKDFFLLTAKPYMRVINVSEEADFNKKRKEYRDLDPVIVSAKFESDLAKLSLEEKKELLNKEYESTLDKIISRGYQLLDLITFYTIKGGKEARAWPIKRGSEVIRAAGLVHSDFAENFIRAEVVDYKHFINFGGWLSAKDNGKVLTQGKDYTVKDGDIIEFKT
jgi:ribosome-binding ATPase